MYDNMQVDEYRPNIELNNMIPTFSGAVTLVAADIFDDLLLKAEKCNDDKSLNDIIVKTNSLLQDKLTTNSISAKRAEEIVDKMTAIVEAKVDNLSTENTDDSTYRSVIQEYADTLGMNIDAIVSMYAPMCPDSINTQDDFERAYHSLKALGEVT